MSVKDRTTMSENIAVTARELDFVTRFARNWQALQEIIGIMRPIRKEPGAVLKSKQGVVTLQSGSVNEGDEIPYSQSAVIETPYAEMGVEKYAKGVSLEAIKNYGYDTAIGLTDDAFLYELQNAVMGKFYTYLKTGTLTNIQSSFQAALAYAKGLVVNKFKKLHRTATDVVGFVNVLDVYEYLGTAQITVQNAFGFNYIKDFMGYGTIILASDDEIPRGKVIAVPVENIVLYYVDPAQSDFARAGLAYTTDGETNLIGFHTEGNYSHAVSECYAIMGMVLFAEYLDAIAVVTIESAGSLASITVTSAAGTAVGDSKVKAVYTLGAGEKLYYKDLNGASAPTYGATVDLTGWTAIEAGKDVNIAGLTASHTLTVVGVNGTNQAVAKGTATIVVKTE